MPAPHDQEPRRATTTNGKPTSRQLAYLKSLANRAGQTFTYPQTSRQASAEINRLKTARPGPAVAPSGMSSAS